MELSGKGPRHRVILAGGALLAWGDLRDTTRDVDSVERLDEDLRAAVASVAERQGLSTDWLNDRAAGFRPATFDVANCALLLDHRNLLVLGVP